MNLGRHLERLVFAVSCSACTGGQTGDEGTGDDPCRVVAEDPLTLEEAIDEGFPVAEALASLHDGSGTQDLFFQGPVRLWTDLGLEPPANRSTRAVLSARSTAATVSRRERKHPEEPEICGDRLEIALDFDLELPDLGTRLSGSGAMPLLRPGDDRSPPYVHALVSLEGLSTECSYWRHTLECYYAQVYATDRCLAPRELAEPFAEPVSGLGLRALLEQASAAFPLELACEGRGPGTVEMEFRVPEDYCPQETESPPVPLVVDVAAPSFAMSGLQDGQATFRETTVPCQRLDCEMTDSCTKLITEQEWDASPQCLINSVGITVGRPLLPPMRVQVNVDASGRKVLMAFAERSSAPGEQPGAEPPPPDFSCRAVKGFQ